VVDYIVFLIKIKCDKTKKMKIVNKIRILGIEYLYLDFLPCYFSIPMIACINIQVMNFIAMVINILRL
jgi:hypothetical protein